MHQDAYWPSQGEFERLFQSGRAVPVMTELVLDHETPVAAYQRLRRRGPSYLLESLDGGETWGRYSLLAAGDSATEVKVEGRRTTVVDAEQTQTYEEEPLAVVRRELERRRMVVSPGVPRFAGGAVGYLGYDLARCFEPLPDRGRPAMPIAAARLVIADTVVVFDNLRHTVKVIHRVDPWEAPASAYARACEAIEATVARLTEPHAVTPALAPTMSGAAFTSAMGEAEFKRAVATVRQAIEAGEAIQVVLSHRLARPYQGDPFDAYRALRLINPSPYMFYLDFGDLEVAGASPEVLVRVEGERLTVRPIAGTRPRGADPHEDQALAEELLADAKERAEHLMLVDLGRNDVGRVAHPGSVAVDEFMVVERYSHVMHLVSEVSGRLARGRDCFDALRAAFPAGTVSGAPKVRAMQLIEELEVTRRGVYAGAVGYFDPQGNMDTCIAIRTLVFHAGQVYAQAGAGIVADSEPEREWRETLHKAEALLGAVTTAEAGLVVPAPTAVAPEVEGWRRPSGRSGDQ